MRILKHLLTCIILIIILSLPLVFCSLTVSAKVEPDITKIVVIDPDIAVLANYIKARNSKMPIELAKVEADVIINSSKEAGVDYVIVNGIIEKETSSQYDPFSTSSEGAKGLMQILRGETVVVDNNRAFDLKYNVETGIKIFKGKLQKNNNDLTEALNQYSCYAKGYSSGVYESIGRFMMYKEKIQKNVAAN